MVWTRRDTWAEVTEDLKLIFGEASLPRLEEQLHRAWGGNKPSPGPSPAPTAPEPVLTVAQAAAELGATPAQASNFDVCPRCGGLKDRWVEPGVSKKTGKPYPGFFGCSTPRCPGR